MNARLRERLKALGASNVKIKSLMDLFDRHGLDERLLEKLIGDIEAANLKAAELGIAYKGAKMSRFPDYDKLDAVYDCIDRIRERQGLTAAIASAGALARQAQDLEAGRAVLKEGKAVYKSQTSPALAAALKAALATLGEERLTAALQELAAAPATGRTTLASSGPQSVATKAARRDPYAQAVINGPPANWQPE